MKATSVSQVKMPRSDPRYKNHDAEVTPGFQIQNAEVSPASQIQNTGVHPRIPEAGLWRIPSHRSYMANPFNQDAFEASTENDSFTTRNQHLQDQSWDPKYFENSSQSTANF